MTAAFASAFGDLHLLRPAWLWALAALPALAWWWHRRRLRASAWRNAVDPHLLPHLLEGGSVRHGWLPVAPALAGYVLAVLALAGPSWERVAQPAWQAPAPLVVALDLSSAASASDLPPSRLLQARARLAALLDARAGGQVGLVAYAGDAFTVAPLTDDAANVALFLDALDPSIMPVDGQRADRAIAWSERLLRQAGFDRGDILLLTDHADAGAIAAAASARGSGYRVSALGLGTPAGAAYRDRTGAIARARLDAGSLRALAGAGGGRYATMTRDLADLRALGVLEPRLEGADAVAGGGGERHWLDGGFWLLPPLMLLALLAFRRGGAVAAVLLLAWLPLRPAEAMEFRDLWQRPDQQAHARLAEGARAYREGNYEAAADAWRALPGPEAQYNLGNALARAGRYREAIAAYDRALERAPGMADAIANRAAVQAFLDRQPPGGGGDGEDDPEREGDGAGGQGSGEPSGQQGAPSPGQGQADAPDAPEEAGAPEGDPQAGEAGGADPADREAQRAADEAQRERMARALEAREGEGEPGNPRAGDPARPGETAEARERRIANEAWLQRVPDDPGGLLRRKFALEYQRRQLEGTR